MQTVRFFTDYLNGDTYYKIEHSEHNWQRTLAQFRLLEQQEKKFKQMQEIVKISETILIIQFSHATRFEL